MNKFIYKSILFVIILFFPFISMAAIMLDGRVFDTAVWQGQTYATGDAKNPPPDEVLDAVKAKIISLGISEDYFNNHFKLSSASISRGTPKNWREIETSWHYYVNEYTINYYVGVNDYTAEEYYVGVGGDLSFSIPIDKLREITKTIPREQAEQLIKSCIPEPQFGPNVWLDKSGKLFLVAETVDYRATVNLETGVKTCKESVSEISEIPERGISDFLTYIIVGTLIGLILVIVFVVILIKSKRKSRENVNLNSKL